MGTSELVVVILVLLTTVASYIVANRYLFYGFEKNHTFSLVIFILVCVCSVGLLEMLVMEILAISSNNFRYYLWIFFISVLCYSTLFAVPALLIKKAIGGLKQHS